MTPMNKLIHEADKLLALMDEVEVDPKLGDETDRVFPRYEFEGIRDAVAKAKDDADRNVSYQEGILLHENRDNGIKFDISDLVSLARFCLVPDHPIGSHPEYLMKIRDKARKCLRDRQLKESAP